MNTVNYITPSDGDIYLVNNQTYVNSGGTDFDKIYNNITVDDSLENIFAGAAKEFGINENFLKAVAQAESGFDPDAVSYCGAQGKCSLCHIRQKAMVLRILLMPDRMYMPVHRCYQSC